MKINFLVISFFALVACEGHDENSKNESEISAQVEKDSTNTLATDIVEPEYTKETFYTEDLGWGYKILMDGKVYINQPHIPAVPGNQGFATEDKALQTADFAIYKMKLGIMPPTISVEELDSLGVLN